MATKRKPVPEVRAERRTELTNAACPRCEGPIYFTDSRGLFCATCHATKLGTAAAPTRPTRGATRDNLDAVGRWIAAGWKLVEALKRDSEVCRLIRTAPPEYLADLERDRERTRRAVARAAAVARWCRIAAFGPNPGEEV